MSTRCCRSRTQVKRLCWYTAGPIILPHCARPHPRGSSTSSRRQRCVSPSTGIYRSSCLNSYQGRLWQYRGAERQSRVNKTVFGMLSDSRDFRFALLDENKKLFVSPPGLVWFMRQSTVIAYIDMILSDAIASSVGICHVYRLKASPGVFTFGEWPFGQAADQRYRTKIQQPPPIPPRKS